MKFNSVQKIILIFYTLIITYIFIFQIPFIETHGNIEYDGIFSNHNKIDYKRLLLVLFFLSFISTSFIIISKKENFNFILMNWKIIILLFFFVLLFAVFIFNSNLKSKVTPIQADVIDTVNTTVVDTAYSPSYTNSNCTTDVALSAFKKEMEFTYPDWKVNGEPVIKEVRDCTFNIRFTSYNPHLRDLGVYEKDVHIVQIQITGDSYYFKEIRGNLY